MTMIKTAMTAAALLLLSLPVQAQSYCAEREVVVERLSGGFGEGLAAGGLRSESQVLEVWAAPDTGTWTVLITQTDGQTCVMASGTNWHQQEPKLMLMGIPG